MQLMADSHEVGISARPCLTPRTAVALLISAQQLSKVAGLFLEAIDLASVWRV